MTSGRYRPSSPGGGAEPVSSGQYWVRVGTRELPITSGETLIGRGEDCTLCINEELVSRRHARIVLRSGQPFIEDLGSANGTFVNQARLHGRAQLFPGDCVFIGTRELEIVARESERTGPAESEADDGGLDRLTPVSGVGEFEHPSTRVERGADGRPQSRPGLSDGGRSDRADTTEQADAFEYLSRLADKMFTMGRVEAAVKILSANLHEILANVRAGGAPPTKLVDAAGRTAVKLATETRDGLWVDMAVETHLLRFRPLRDETRRALIALRARHGLGDDALIARYYETLRTVRAALEPEEQVLCDRVAELVPGIVDEL